MGQILLLFFNLMYSLKFVWLVSLVLLGTVVSTNPTGPYSITKVIDNKGNLQDFSLQASLQFTDSSIIIHGCNNNISPFEWVDQDGGFKSDGIFMSTRMYCPQDQDSTLINAMKKGVKAKVQGSHIVITDSLNHPLLKAQAQGEQEEDETESSSTSQAESNTQVTATSSISTTSPVIDASSTSSATTEENTDTEGITKAEKSEDDDFWNFGDFFKLVDTLLNEEMEKQEQRENEIEAYVEEAEERQRELEEYFDSKIQEIEEQSADEGSKGQDGHDRKVFVTNKDGIKEITSLRKLGNGGFELTVSSHGEFELDPQTGNLRPVHNE